MSPRDPTALPDPFEALLRDRPVPARGEAEDEQALRAVLARLARGREPSSPSRPDDDALLAAPLPRTADEPESLTRPAPPRLAATQRWAVGLTVLAAAATLLLLVRVARRPATTAPPSPAAATLAEVGGRVRRPPPPPDVEPSDPDGPLARLDDLPPAELAPTPSPEPRPRAARRGPSPAAATAPPAEAPTPAAEPDEFDTPLQHAESRSVALAPSTGEAIAALAPGQSRARRCVAGHQEPSTAVITFASDGTVSRVAVSGPAAGTAAGPCIEAAFEGARVAPFAKPSFSISYPVRP